MSTEDQELSRNKFSDSLNTFICTNKITPYRPGLLSGLTFAIKDNIDVANEITGYGNPFWLETHSQAVVNAVCIDQLLSEGATCLGKTHSDELAYSLIGINSFYGTPLNPKAPDRVPGGSSSGSASAVASGLVGFALGTDTGGSIRIPANNCGIWGYRPSHGLISVAGVKTLAPSFDTVGVLAHTGDILEKIMKVLIPEEEQDSSNSLSVYFLEDIFEQCDKKILETMLPILDEIFRNIEVGQVRLSNIMEGVNCEWLFQHSGFLLSAEIWNTFGAWVEHINPTLSSGVAANFESYAKAIDRAAIQNNLFETKCFSQKLNKFLGKRNILCFPTALDLAPKLEHATEEFLTKNNYYPRTMAVTAISTLSRTPEITIPITQVAGVPVGLSFIASYGEDMRLVNFCNKL